MGKWGQLMPTCRVSGLRLRVMQISRRLVAAQAMHENRACMSFLEELLQYR